MDKNGALTRALLWLPGGLKKKMPKMHSNA
jgi:hypothetical protein